MAKLQEKYSFSKANISFENGRYIITEFGKDSTADYDLTEILNNFLDKDGVVLSIGIDGEPNSIGE